MMNNTINEIKNSLEGTNSRITEAEEQISDLEDKIVEITTAEQNKEKRMKRIEDSLRDLWVREFSTTNPALQQMLKAILWAGNTREGKYLQ